MLLPPGHVYGEAANTPAASDPTDALRQAGPGTPPRPETGAGAGQGFTDAAAFGFSPDASGTENTKALQRAVDQGGAIVVSREGTYPVAGTVFLGSNTRLVFGPGVFLKKVVEADGPFSSVLLNKGALTRTWDRNIEIDGLQIIVNGVDVRKFLVYGLHGQLALFYVDTATIRGFRCLDLGRAQYAIHVCTFKNLTVTDAVIHGMKDGVHLGRGSHFHIADCHFRTGDDAIALNGHDYSTGNPEIGLDRRRHHRELLV